MLLAELDEAFGAAQHARRRTADLNVCARSDGAELELRVEGRDLEDADIGHAQHVGDLLDRRAGNPAVLVLRPHQ